MKFCKLILATLVLSALSTISYAKEYTFTVDLDFYAGGGYSFMGYQIAGAESADMKLLYLQGGVTIFDWVSLEARLGSGISDGNAFLDGPDVDLGIKLDSFYGMYAKVGYPHLAPFYFYGIMGNTTIESTVDIDGYGKVDESESGMSYGAGLDFNLSGLNPIPTWFNFLGFEFSEFNIPDTIIVNAEYLQYLNNDSVKIGGFNMGIKYQF